jgi:hypothetical protein
MEPVIIKHRILAVIDIIIGGYLMFVGIGHLIVGEYPMEFMKWFGALFNIVIGAIIIVSLFGSYISRISVCENNLKIKWSTRFREFIVPDSEIKIIILSKSYVEIQRQGKKALVLSMEFWRKESKTKIHEFLTKYARQKNLALDIRYDLTT